MLIYLVEVVHVDDDGKGGREGGRKGGMEGRAYLPRRSCAC